MKQSSNKTTHASACSTNYSACKFTANFQCVPQYITNAGSNTALHMFDG